MKILIIEDDHKIASALKRGLEQENFTVDNAYDGPSGYELATSDEYAAIILDIMLPELNGYEVCKKLRAESIHTPILMLTAKSELENKIEGLNIGADDYLTKPFAFEELLARVKALTRRPNNILESKLSYEDLTLDTNNFKVMRGDTEIHLTKKEYSILEFLLRNKENIVTKDQLINRLWDYDSDILPNTIEQYISYLRNKIDRNFKSKPALIRTIRGFGYKISSR
jgi:DNA-binding response OmpR family regulator